jgi:adenosylhomocysteine nucleosidase
MPPVLVTFALPEESTDFLRALQDQPIPDVGVEYVGVGPAKAAERIASILARQRPHMLICTGFAGGLDPRLGIADLVIAENLSTPELCAQASALPIANPRVFVGGIVSREATVESVERKTALFHESGALAVDMESEAVAAACHSAGIPLLVVRTISDPAGAPLPVPFSEWFDLARQRPRALRLVQFLALHPGRILPFARFVRGLAPARRTLAEFLVHTLAALP